MKDRIKELLLTNNHSQHEVARIVAKEQGIDNPERIRWHVRQAAKDISEFKEYCDEQAIDVETVRQVWDKSKRFSIKYTPNSEPINYDQIFTNLLSDAPKVKKIKQPKTKTFDRIVFTDTHVGMETDAEGIAPYATKWDANALFSRINIMVNEMLKNKKSDVLYIDDLGDYMDGFDGLTTRGGHKLPQNMTNHDAFDNGLKAKIMLVDELSKHYEYITVNNVNNDNHSASFGYTVNSAFKQICDVKYDNVEVHNHKSFLSYYFVGNHCFVITHGKDAKHMKFGFKPQLDHKTTYKIDQFLKNEKIYKKAEFIEISKGDSHQCLFDMCSSDDFDYFCYPALSPSSEWVQTNFTKGRSGFVTMTISVDSNDKTVKPYFFN
jgi:hypothetical protein